MLKLLEKAQIVLFDFDGLLVNTEDLHFKAYQLMCKHFGYDLTWDFKSFCDVAHKNSTGIKEKIYLDFPALQDKDWSYLYDIKKGFYKKLLQEGGIQLMPGVEKLLQYLQKKGVKRAVVTNSFKEQIDLIKKQIPILESIPLWVTREDYKSAKPEPDGYLKALELLEGQGDVAIGFEDTLRGYCALSGAKVEGVVVSEVLSEEFRDKLSAMGAKMIPSFESFSL